MSPAQTDRLELSRPHPQRDAEAVYELTARSFGRPYWRWRSSRPAWYFGGHYDWAASTVGRLGGRIVTHCGVWGFRMRVGRAVLRVAGIGAVCTEGNLQRRGLMARTLPAACDAMAAAGYDLALLYGIRDFYHRFGFVPAWPDHCYVVRAEDLPPAPAGLRLQPIRPRHRPELADLYNRHHAGLTGTAVRPTYLRREDDWLGRCWRDPAGRVCGYVFFRVGPAELHVGDCAGEPDSVLGALGRLARRHGRAEVRLRCLHHDSAAARRLRRGTCRIETTHLRSGDAMARTLNLAACLKRLAPELGRRLRAARAADWTGCLLLADGRERVGLHIRAGRVTVGAPTRTAHAVRGGDEIARLLIGGAEPGEIVSAAGTRLRGRARMLLPILLPHCRPTLAPWDHF